MSVNNIELIKSLLSFDDTNDFYFLQIIKRRKDNPDMPVGSQTLKTYYIDSFESYDKIIPFVINYCENENARAYIRLNRRNYQYLSLKLLSRCISYISSNDFKPLPNVFDTVASEFHRDPIKKWLIDIDNDEVDMRDLYLTSINGEVKMVYGEGEFSKLYSTVLGLQLQTNNEPRMIVIPTKNGVHLITRPFNLKKFRESFPKINVHKDATTLLVMP